MVKSKGKARAQNSDPNTTPLTSHRADLLDHDEDMPDADTTRKRGYDTQEDINGESQIGLDTPPSKRRRSTNWPLPAQTPFMALQPPDSHQRQVSTGSERPSKFLEGSMNDRTSEKPPSVFTRLFHGSTTGLSVDHLMADYEEDTNRPATARQNTARTATRISASPTKNAQPPHNASVASVTTAESKRSGIFRFGRSLASSFNPANLWHRIQGSYKEAADEVMEEHMSKTGNDVDDRKARAEQEYARMKASGHFAPTKVFVRGSVGPNNTDTEPKQRDSGIEMDDARSSLENGNSLSVPPSAASASGASDTRKSPFHFKTPSLSNLKRVRSEAQLKSPGLPSHSQSPEKASFDIERTIRKQQSKKDIQKQHKLSKRVSDLESKLEQARRELDRALGPAPPLPALPAHLADAQTPKPRQRSASPQKRAFTPGALPSLPSERLLFPEQLHGDGTSQSERPPAHISQAEETQNLTEIAKMQQQDSIMKGDIWTDDLETPAKANGMAAPPKRKVTKKRKSGDRDDGRYKPDSEDNDDEEWNPAPAAAKKRRSNGKTAQNTSPPSKEKTNPTPKKHGNGRLTKKNTTFNESASVVTDKPMTENTIGPDDSVTITKLPLKDEPSHPTATATPSQLPRERQSRSTTGNKLRRKESHRSLSPANRAMDSSPDQIVTAAPDGFSVPPLPNLPNGVNGGRKSREDDGWDGFGEEIF